MRVLLSGRRRDERGATAILVAILATTLVMISAFTVDFGQAFMSKRNLQKGADAGALAGAQALTQFPGSCASVASNSTALQAAHDAADLIGKSNRESYLPASSETEFSVSCDPNLKVLEVRYGLKGDTDSMFGPLAGGSSSITTNRRAQATVDVAPQAGQGVRPLALCSAQVTFSTPPADYPFLRLDNPKNSSFPPDTCPGYTPPGGWWVIDCPDEDPGEKIEVQISEGCENPVSLVPGQEDELTPGELTVVLGEECAPKDDDQECLSGDTGNMDSGKSVTDGWQHLLDDETPSVFPVFCSPPQCDASSIEGTGTNAIYPVYKLVTAVICGFHFSKTERDHSTTGECDGLPTSMYAGDDESDNTVNYMIIKFINFRSSGSNVESECALGAACDGGLRRTRLTG